MSRSWKHRERVGDDCCDESQPMSWNDMERDREERRQAMTTKMSAKTGYKSEPINPDEALYRKPWSK